MSASVLPRKARLKAARLGLVGLILSFFCALGGGDANAEGLKVETEVSQTGQWDSNPLLLSQGAEDVFASITSPSVTLTGKTPTSELSAFLGLDENIYSKASMNSDDLNGKASFATASERWKLAFDGGGAYDTTRTSELTTLGIDTTNSRHTGVNAAPSIAYNVTPLDTLSVKTSYSRSSYDSDAYTNYHIVSATPAYESRLTPTLGTFAAVQLQRYQAESGRKARIDSIGPTVGFGALLSERLTLRAQVGSQASKQTWLTGSVPAGDWKWSTIFSGNLDYKGEVDTLSLAARREKQPYANGTESNLTTLEASLQHALNDSLTFSTRASYQIADAASQEATDLDSITNGKVSLTYHVTKELGVTASGQYKFERLTSTSKPAKETIATLGMTLKSDWGEE